MKPVRVASGLYLLLAAHVAADGAYPLLNGWKVKLESVPFFISAGLLWRVVVRWFRLRLSLCRWYWTASSRPAAIRTQEVSCLMSFSSRGTSPWQSCFDVAWPLTNCCKRRAKTLALEQCR